MVISLDGVWESITMWRLGEVARKYRCLANMLSFHLVKLIEDSQCTS